MSEMLDVMGFAALSAQVLVTEMVKSSWTQTRLLLAKAFRRGGEETEARHLEMLDEDQSSLEQATTGEHGDIDQNLQSKWAIQIAALLQQYPEVRVDLQAMMDSASTQPDPISASANLSAINNKNSQIIQTLGNMNTGGGSINYRSPGKG